MDLLTVAVLPLLLVPSVFLTEGPLRIALGLPFVLFFPGYNLIAALFPSKRSLVSIERVALSFGLSIAVVLLLGLYTPWGIRLVPIVVSLAMFVLAMVGLGLYRQHRLRPEERFEVNFRSALGHCLPSWRGQVLWDRVLTILLVMVIAGAIGTLAYVIQSPKVEDRFTEFFILGPGGKAENYPTELTLGDAGKVILGIANNEHETAVYRVEIRIDGEKVGDLGPITLDHEEEWQREVAFAPARSGPDQKVQFLLYKGGASEASESLHLWVDVKEGS